MQERISPRVDLAFKKIFGTEENKDLLISLINSIVGKDDQVVGITLLNPYNQKNFKNDKLSILDIKAEGSDGKKFNIEIQITDEADYDKRALYYWAKLYSNQLKESGDYAELEKVIGIHILNFTSIPESPKYHNAFHVTEKETRLHFFKEFELHTIELKKFLDQLGQKPGDLGSKLQTSLDLWTAFLTRNDLLNMAKLPQSLKDVPIKKAIRVLDIMNFTVEEREAYEDHLKWLRIEANTLKKAEGKGYEKGKKEGRKKEKLAIAEALLQKGMSVDEIIEITTLSQKEIANLMIDDRQG